MVTDESLDLLFSPSKWTKRAVPDVIKLHIDVVTQASKYARKNIPCELNVAYGYAEKEKLDIYGTDLPPDAPIFVYIHGGYWQQLDKDISAYLVESFHRKDIKVIVIGYTLCPNCTLKEIVQEIRNAYVKCLEYAKKCGSKGIYVGGHSAGGHLTASLFQEFFCSMPEVDQHYLKGVVCISGVYDLVPIVRTYVNDALGLTEELAKELSPLHQSIRANKTIHFLVLIGQHESPAFHEQSTSFYQKLVESGYNAELVEIKDVDHFTIVENLNDTNSKIFTLITNAIEKNTLI
ncbi:hypothetical protein PPYR_04835 [Photinus pyralis]|uniref:Alpha/beta hydrolase fold-3 domain-containing protein n=1 Tax=Photinus pyralis TaxID=7054 RepID=A0A1Y1MDP1_PHOPY|nr:kynurenine formamidase-like [Photinus pyralis]KAB0802649.1 hypothetical protein PPYR_04835 [Photinus pyralis]